MTQEKHDLLAVLCTLPAEHNTFFVHCACTLLIR